MANVRDLLIGAVLSGIVTFGTTFYFAERDHARDMEAEKQRAAHVQDELRLAQEAAEAQARRDRTWEIYRDWQSEDFAARRDTLFVAIRARPTATFASWDTGPGASEARSSAFRDVLRFYGNLGVALRAGQLDEGLVRDLFGPNVLWWQERALPALCRDYLYGSDDLFDNALYTFHLIAGDNQTMCLADGESPLRMFAPPAPMMAPPN